ncbi:MAG: hypothetical protein H5U01_11895, partial [Clostridia bacterium]|nr:hypothetical protein [Clostridia bacterium]
VAVWARQGHPALFGDAADPEFLATLPLSRAHWVVAAFSPAVNLTTAPQPLEAFVQALRDQGYAGRIAVTAHAALDVPGVRKTGADLVLLPFADAARHAVERLLTWDGRLGDAPPVDLQAVETAKRGGA